MTQEVSQVQGQIQPNGFVTSRHLTSLSTEVKASAEDFPVVRLYMYVRTLPIWDSLIQQQTVMQQLFT